MDIIQHPNTTRILGAPVGWDHSKAPCGSLPIVDSKIDGCMYSYWKPSPYDIERLQLGAVLQLGVVGSSHPPVSLVVIADPLG